MAVKDYFDHQETQERLSKLRAHHAELKSYPKPDPTAEQIERERWQYASNRHAELYPMYSAARSVAVWRPVLPLEPLGTNP